MFRRSGDSLKTYGWWTTVVGGGAIQLYDSMASSASYETIKYSLVDDTITIIISGGWGTRAA